MARTEVLDMSEFEVKQLREGCANYGAAVVRALGSRKAGGLESEGLMSDFTRRAAKWGLAADLVFAAYTHGRLVGSCAALESPGHAALVWVGPDPHTPAEGAATQAALRALRVEAERRSIKLLEVLLPPEATTTGPVLSEAGFGFLTRLLYLSRPLPGKSVVCKSAQDLEWVGYSPQSDALFCTALERAYVGTLDCPQLAGVRSTRDILAGHRATGLHDPGLWWVVRRQAEPVGVLLLTSLETQPALELVYVGVAQVARGTGVANALLHRMVELGRQFSANLVTLAVDRGNTPARRFYARWGFVEIGKRDAWIATSVGARS